ncbi:hypothetical protein BH10PAT1_BH10PAT1_7260 [soil metagenome]
MENRTSLTRRQYRLASHIEDPRITQALLELGLNPPEIIAGNKISQEFSPEIQDALDQHTRRIYPSQLPELKERGSVLSNHLHEKLGVDPSRAFAFLNSVLPEWKEELYNSVEEGRMVHIVDPELVIKLERYRDLTKERQILGTCRSLMSRGLMVNISEETAAKIIESNDIIKLDLDDLKMLRNILKENKYYVYLIEALILERR